MMVAKTLMKRDISTHSSTVYMAAKAHQLSYAQSLDRASKHRLVESLSQRCKISLKLLVAGVSF